MNDKVRELKAVPKKPVEPDAELVAVAERLLTDIKSGKVTHFVGLADHADGESELVGSESPNVYEQAGVFLFMAIASLGFEVAEGGE